MKHVLVIGGYGAVGRRVVQAGIAAVGLRQGFEHLPGRALAAGVGALEVVLRALLRPDQQEQPDADRKCDGHEPPGPSRQPEHGYATTRCGRRDGRRSDAHTSEPQTLMTTSDADFSKK